MQKIAVHPLGRRDHLDYRYLDSAICAAAPNKFRHTVDLVP